MLPHTFVMILIAACRNHQALVIASPYEARALLSSNPQLSYALFQAMLCMGIVDPALLSVSNLSHSPTSRAAFWLTWETLADTESVPFGVPSGSRRSSSATDRRIPLRGTSSVGCVRRASSERVWNAPSGRGAVQLQSAAAARRSRGLQRRAESTFSYERGTASSIFDTTTRCGRDSGSSSRACCLARSSFPRGALAYLLLG